MSMVQIISWTASDAYLTNSAILGPALENLSRSDGCICVHSGLSEEDKTTLCIFVVLEVSVPHKLVVDEHVYLRNSGILPSMKHDKFLTNYIVRFNNKVFPAMKAPTMEVTFMTLKEGKTKKRLNDILASAATKPEVANSPYAPLAWGDVEGTADKVYLLFGWESSEKHKMTVQQPTFLQFIADLIETVDFTFCHVQYQTIYFTKSSALYM